ncbi:hypothetical protein MSG28_013462 [Choristoneura fumiferana]|uniref:Uncharacterized protein n=1 Tax=Choristoneura fumiferana TaxID=7141 RepID=A0ACC0KU16_CHOFU|nr:hypothetical protein MSG28_013462 [Choristoneura fumiferana]
MREDCSNPNPVCPAQCNKGCSVRTAFKSAQRQVRELEDCPKAAYKLDTSEPRQECPPTEEYRFCEPCNRTCEDPNPVCPAQCARGCFCKDDLLRDKDGSCVEYGKCSKFAKNESCELVFWFKEIRLRARRGVPLLRLVRAQLLGARAGLPEGLHAGLPLPSPPQKCLNPNEEFVCRYGCEARCGGGGGCIGRPRRCQLGCHCRLGLLRDPATGHCVTPAQCKEKDMKRVVFTKDTDTLARIKQIIGDSNVKVEVVES